MVGPFLTVFFHRLEILNHHYNKIKSSSGKQYLVACHMKGFDQQAQKLGPAYQGRIQDFF